MIHPLSATARAGDDALMQPHTPHHGSDLDFSLVAMAIVMTLAIVFLLSQLA